MDNEANKNIILKNTFKRLLFIQILSSLSAFIGPFIDSIVVGQFLGAQCMAAFGIVAPLAILITAFSNIFNAGSQNIAGKYLGQGKSDKINSLFTTTILWAIGIGLIITVGLIVFSKPIAVLFGAGEETIKLCTDYMVAYSIGIIPTLIMPSLVGFLQLDNGGKTAVTASAVMIVSDLILDLLAVFVFKNGMLGIGFATTGSYYIAVIILFTHILKKDSKLKFTFKEFPIKDIGRVITLGFPAAILLLCNVVRVSVTNNIILRVSDLDSVAVFAIQNSFRALLLAFTLGTGLTTLLVCSFIAGEENRSALRREMAYIFKIGIIISIIVAAVVIVCAKYPFSIMFCAGESEEFIELVAKAIRIYAISIPFYMLEIIFIYYYQSMRSLLRATIISILGNVAFYLIVIEILSGIIGVDGVWYGYILSDILTLITVIVITWVKNKKFPLHVHDFLLLPEGFGVQKEDRINVTVNSVEQAIGISGKIIDFCKSKGIDSKRTMAAGLCMEELAVIAINNCNAKNAYVDLYLTYKNGDLNIRMMDNARPFDRNLLAGIPDDEDPCAHVGVRIVKGLAKDVSYNVVLGMNAYSLVI